MPYGKGSKRKGTKSGGGPHNTPYKFVPFGGIRSAMNNPNRSMGRHFGLGGHGLLRETMAKRRLPKRRDAMRGVASSMFGGFRKLYRGKYEK